MPKDEQLERILKNSETIREIREEQLSEIWDLLLEAVEILQQIDPKVRPRIPDHISYEILEEQDGCCAICGSSIEDNFHVDHIVPFSLGGGNERFNLQVTHQSCNQSKGAKFDDPWALLRYLEFRYMNLPSHLKQQINLRILPDSNT